MENKAFNTVEDAVKAGYNVELNALEFLRTNSRRLNNNTCIVENQGNYYLYKHINDRLSEEFSDYSYLIYSDSIFIHELKCRLFCIKALSKLNEEYEVYDRMYYDELFQLRIMLNEPILLGRYIQDWGFRGEF